MTPYQWHDQNLAQATLDTGGVWHNLTGTFTATRIITDTRKLQVGDIFLALKGDNFDGHEFGKLAQDKGAIAVIGERALDCELPQLMVSDSRLALGLLGKYRRDAHPDLTVIAITGSSGKTTTKEMLGSIFSQIAPTLITRGNLNNDLGVPMMLLELSDEHKFAVMELGANHVGEIAYTASLVRPDVACVLNIGTAHLGEFGGQENIARAKAEIYQGLTDSGVAVVPFGDKFADLLTQLASQTTKRILTFGEKSVSLAEAGINLSEFSDDERAELESLDSVLLMGDVFADDVDVANTHSNFTLTFNPSEDELDSTTINLPFIGEHNVTNALAAASCALALGVSLDVVCAGLETAVAPKGRLTRIVFGEHLLIDDTYNANPTSMLVAADVLANEVAEQKILVLGDIAELGDEAVSEHGKLGRDLADKVNADSDISHVLTVGTLMSHCTKAITGSDTALQSEHFADKGTLLLRLKELLATPSCVLFKGSRSATMETLIGDLTQNPT